MCVAGLWADAGVPLGYAVGGGLVRKRMVRTLVFNISVFVEIEIVGALRPR